MVSVETVFKLQVNKVIVKIFPELNKSFCFGVNMLGNYVILRYKTETRNIYKYNNDSSSEKNIYKIILWIYNLCSIKGPLNLNIT